EASLTPPYELRVTATARQVWVWVSVDGGPRRAISLERGESVTWNAQEGFLLSVDDAGGVAATLNGAPLPRLGSNSQVLRNLYIPSPELPPVG
ncbi:MAG: cytoskeleton protein RodZ, partial [Candidatus Binatota bacterium]|nr:cytoskeleton protein RodZ [Candidatus Binatota bacterium]